ncbi:MAG: DUF3623 domain-containing protein [Sphingomonas sp.]|nr:DUF3623 domain-containing protein [Sphingomonas sp.]
MSVPPLLFALVVWFFGTAAVVWLDSRPRATFRRSFRGAGVVALLAFAAILLTASDSSMNSVYIAFAASVAIWGWHEMGFLMGFVSGPSHDPCPPGARGWERFKLATATVIHHEVALALTVVLLFAVTWGQPNHAAPLAFALLFGMRLSAKLNLFLGVPSLSDEVFPAHLAYLKTYFRKARCNWLYPFSIALGSTATGWAWTAAEAAKDPGTAASYTLVAGLAFLGVVEHLFLVLPIRDAMMYRWAAPQPVKAKTIRTERG